MNYRDSSYLFYTNDLRLVIEAQSKALSSEVANLNENQLLNTDENELKKYLKDKYYLHPLLLKEDEIYIDHNEVDVDVRGDPNRFIRNMSQPFYIKGSEVTFHIPFSGDKDLLQCSPSTHFVNPLKGEISGNEIILIFNTVKKDSDKLRTEFDRSLGSIKTTISRVNTDIQSFNDNIENTIENQIKSRKEKLSQTSDFVGNLGFPLKKRPDTPDTYLVSMSRKIEPVFPTVHDFAQTPEPILDLKQYNEILSLIKNSSLVMERSPKVFRDMGEEDIRTNILVHLNGVYEGQATGETFNNKGKTDILIRNDGKNIFIAECKFWEGPVYFSEGLTQLFGYSAWRDSKLAYLIFNRNKDTSKVLIKISEIMKKHPNVLTEEEFGDATEFRYKIKHPQDVDKEASLTIMVFDIPK